jgi:hypothetical protein
VPGLLPFPKWHHHGLSEENGVLQGELGKPFRAFPSPKIFGYGLIGFGNNDHLLSQKHQTVMSWERIN